MNTWDRIQQLADREGHRLGDVAEAAGVGASAVTKWRRGKNIAPEHLKKIAVKYGVTVDSLLGRDIPGLVHTGMSRADESRLLAESAEKGAETTNWYAQMVFRRMEDLRIVPPEHHAEVRADLNRWLDRYQQWCAANSDNEAALTQHSARQGRERKPSDETTPAP